ncbi:MAG: P27 family phage terminase small subunit [Thermodesulfobacteriota bacterium]
MKAPKHLSRGGKKIWTELQAEYQIVDPGGLLILTAAIEAHDRMRQAQETLSREGATFPDRFGQPRPHPATVIERDSRAAMLAALKQLNLDLEPLRDGPGRPPGRK